jgi:integrase
MICNQSVTTKILTRGKTHYLRYRIPVRIQALGYPKEVVKSLKTQDYLFAQNLVLPKIPIMQRIAMSTDTALLKSLFDELSDFSFTDRLDKYEREGVSDSIYNEVDHIRDCMEDGCQPLHPDFPSDIAKLTSHQEPLKTIVSEGQGELYKLLLTLIEAHAANAASGRSEGFYGLLDRAKSIAVPVSTGPVVSDSISFSALYAEFLKYKVERGNLSQKIQDSYGRYFKTLSEIVEDKPCNKFTKKDVRDALLAYSDLPLRNKNPYRDMSIRELLDFEAPSEDLVSTRTVTDVRKLFQGIFRFAIDNGYLKESPARDLNLKFLSDEKRSYAPYSDPEVLTILSAVQAETKKPYKRWLPLLAAYTGARRGELVQLRKQDIKQDAASARWYLEITDQAGSVKNNQSNRCVPLHADVVKAGFLTFVNQSVSDKLFDVEPNRVTNWFRGFRRGLGISDYDQNGCKKVFHSFRHTVITRLKAANVNDSLQKAVVGHEIDDNSINQTTYTHLDTMPLSAFLPVIDALGYKK